ncbi:MAG: recombination mediator RecR [Weeksellaceae bacterium]|nr:recombination mediator RecR [Weeksellaceae bacterium]
MNFPSKVLEAAIEELAQLPGIGRRTAMRLALHMLKRNATQTLALSDALTKLVNEVRYCKVCFSLSNADVCEICSNGLRNDKLICVVQDIRDVMAIENTGQYRGLYHVLGGLISPMDGVGPAQLTIQPLVTRALDAEEVILALSSTMEGDTTNFYLYKVLRPTEVKVSVIARGIGIGDELEYTDETTLASSISHRVLYADTIAE